MVKKTGSYTGWWDVNGDDGFNLSGGIYFCILKIGETVMDSKKFVVID